MTYCECPFPAPHTTPGKCGRCLRPLEPDERPRSLSTTPPEPQNGDQVVWFCPTCERVAGITIWPNTVHDDPHGCPLLPLGKKVLA